MSVFTILQVEILAGNLKGVLEREIPAALGPNATENQLRRQLYWTTETIRELEKNIDELKEVCSNSKDDCQKLSVKEKELKENQFHQKLVELGVSAMIVATKPKLELWNKFRVQLAQRLDVQLDFTEIPSATPNTSQHLIRLETNKLQRPPIQLRRFDGKIENWCAFWETYRVLIHEDSTLSHVEKFNILESILDKEAKDLIEGLQMTNEGYNTAIDLLLSRFGNDKKLIRSLNQELLNLPTSETFEDDEKLHLKIEKLCRQLKSLKQNIDDAPYFMTLEGKVSSKVLGKYLTIKDAEDRDDWNTAKFRNALGRAIDQIRNKLEIKQKPNSVFKDRIEEPTLNFAVNYSNKATTKRFSHERVERPRGREEGRLNRSKTKWPCQFCDGPHTQVECSSLRTAEERRDKASEKGLCFKCLKKGHFANDCYVPKRRCLYCGKAHHHSALCERKFGEAKEIQELNKGVSAAATQKEIVGALKSVETDHYDRPLEVSGDQLDNHGVRSEKVSQKIFKGGGIYDETNTSLVLKVPISKKLDTEIEERIKDGNKKKLCPNLLSKVSFEIESELDEELKIDKGEINLNKVVSNQKLEHEKTREIISPLKDEKRPSNFKWKTPVRMQPSGNRRPLVARSPIVVIGDDRALELRKILREEKLRGMVFKPKSWDSNLFNREIQLTKNVDTLVVWTQSINKGLFEVLKKANEHKKIVKKIVWIKPFEGLEIQGLNNVTSFQEPEHLHSILINLNRMGTPLISVRNKDLGKKNLTEASVTEPKSSFVSNSNKYRFREFYPSKNFAEVKKKPCNKLDVGASAKQVNNLAMQQMADLDRDWSKRICAQMPRMQRTKEGCTEPISFKGGGCRSSTF
uniref:CCHC-type domain-containing protein n=1 Tax=Meloidogyne floridensis TaxID=298350 RepID=A0A915NFM1_9BILA